MCLSQGHITVTPVRPESAAPQSLVKHSTTEPLCSLAGKEIINLLAILIVSIIYWL